MMYKGEVARPLIRSRSIEGKSSAVTWDGEPFGKDSYMRYEKSTYTLTIQAHGAPGNTGHKSASAVVKVIDQFMLEKGIKKSAVRRLDLHSCYARTGGIFSQASALSNMTGFKVFAVDGRYSNQRGNSMNASEPNRFELVRALSKKGNKVMFRLSEAGLSIASRIRRTTDA